MNRKYALAWVKASESAERTRACLALLKEIHPVSDPGFNWDANKFLLPCANGVVNLQTGELAPGRPEDLCSLGAYAAYDPNATCPRWMMFLNEIFDSDADLIDFIWRAIGYSLSGATNEQCLFLLHGVGANGKTTFLRVLRAALGDYAADTPFSTFEARQAQNIPNDLAALVSKRIVTASEADVGARMSEARIKSLTGSDVVTARFLHGEFFSFLPHCKLWLCVNHPPKVWDDSYAYWRRIRLIPFNVQFRSVSASPEGAEIAQGTSPGATVEGRDAPPLATRVADRGLFDKLMRELPGILAWAVAGCQEWLKHGLEPPGAVKEGHP